MSVDFNKLAREKGTGGRQVNIILPVDICEAIADIAHDLRLQKRELVQAMLRDGIEQYNAQKGGTND